MFVFTTIEIENKKKVRILRDLKVFDQWKGKKKLLTEKIMLVSYSF